MKSEKNVAIRFVSSTNINWQLLMVDLRERVPFLLRVDQWGLDDDNLRNLITDNLFFSKSRREFLKNLVKAGKLAEKTIEKDKKRKTPKKGRNKAG